MDNYKKLIPLSAMNLIIRISVYIFLWFLISACGKNYTSLSMPTLPVTFTSETAYPTYSFQLTPTVTCTDGLSFINDVTFPDNSFVAPGITIDKQWLVQNSGSCNWDSRYRLRMINGVAMGTSTEQALFPARAGMQAILRIVFTAPLGIGNYISEWQAFDARGIPFGEAFYIKIIVQ